MKNIFILMTISFSSIASDALVAMGERLFLEDRFSQFFFIESNGDVNSKLVRGSRDLEEIDIFGQTFPSPFAGSAKSCASCHMVDQALDDFGMRAYNEFSQLSKIPARSDLKTHTPRNTPNLVGIGSKWVQNRTSHWDGEFFDHSETVLGNMTGRNMGWLAYEKDIALKNIVKVIRGDNGSGELAQEFGGSYKKVLLGTARSIPEDLRLETNERINVDLATDQEIINYVIKAVNEYMNDLDFEKDEKGNYIGSPYDQFLIANGIDTVPKNGESIFRYRHRLRSEFAKLSNPKFVKKKYFEIYDKEIGFGTDEFEGLKIFFNLSQNSRGMCIACHVPPLFSDQFYYNVGTTQLEYEEIHGLETFNGLKVPSFSERGDILLMDRPSKKDPLKIDLGLWNFYARNKEVTKVINSRLCHPNDPCDLEKMLPLMIGRIKVPSLRLNGLNAPYFHHGKTKTLREAIDHYRQTSTQLKTRQFRNIDPRVKNALLGQSDIKYLEAFLNSLNEHYE